MDKREVATILNDIGIMLELKGENPFKARAYYNGARAIERLDEDLRTMVEEGTLGNIDGIGEALEEKITELVATGTLIYYEELKASFPSTLFELLQIPGLGPKRVKSLYENLNITNIGELEYACMENRLLTLPGFGPKMQDNILRGIENLKLYRNKYLYLEAYTEAEEIIDRLKRHPDTIDIDIAGSLRRHKEVIGDVDIVLSANCSQDIMNLFSSLPKVDEVIAKGNTKTSIRLKNGMAVDLRVVKPHQYPYVLNHFTGSKEHNTHMRHIAKERGLKINEYGVFNIVNKQLIPCRDERDIYAIFDMDYIPPELREDRGEIEAAKKHSLPKLVSASDIKGVFHIHSVYSDGLNTIEELAQHARNLGYRYMGISDHSRSAYYANGLAEDDIYRQFEEIEVVNRKYDDFKILKGIEADILKDGSMDYDDDILSMFDFVIASVHSNFTMDREEMTERILKALENPYVKILGHPTGRLLLSREGYDVDMERILEKAAEKGVAIEINSNPYRLDLDWRWCRVAKDMGVDIVICPDAHDLEGFDYVSLGIGIARKGWLEAEDIWNCRDMW